MRVHVIGVTACLVLMAAYPATAKTLGAKRTFVDGIIVHTISGPYTKCQNGRVRFSGAPGDAQRWKRFFDKHRSLGIHYVVDRAGAIAASTPEYRVARHTMHNNSTTIGIELVHNGDGKEPFGKLQIDALLRLVKDIRSRHTIPIRNILGHEHVDRRTFSCAGRSVKRKQDPGANFPWRRLRAALTSVPRPRPWVASVRRFMRGEALLPNPVAGRMRGAR